jgi:hypothetical protein
LSNNMAGKPQIDPAGKQAATVLVAVRMTPTQAAKVQRLADRRKVTMSQVVREAVEDMRG